MTASKIAARFAPYMKINPTKIGLALADLGFEQIRRKNGRFWKLYERPASDIGNVLPDGEEPPQKTCHFKSKGVTGVTLVTDNIYILCVL